MNRPTRSAGRTATTSAGGGLVPRLSPENIIQKNLSAWWRGEEATTISQQGGFCSEFVAELYKSWQLLPSDRPSRYYVPQDFAQNASLKLLQGRLSSAWLLQI